MRWSWNWGIAKWIKYCKLTVFFQMMPAPVVVDLLPGVVKEVLHLGRGECCSEDVRSRPAEKGTKFIFHFQTILNYASDVNEQKVNCQKYQIRLIFSSVRPLISLRNQSPPLICWSIYISLFGSKKCSWSDHCLCTCAFFPIFNNFNAWFSFISQKCTMIIINTIIININSLL